MEKWTQIIIVSLPLMIGLLDVALLKLGGNQVTISRVALKISLQQPMVALAICYSFAVLIGHLFFPETTRESPPYHETIGRMFVVLSPTIYAMIIIYAGDGAAKIHKETIRPAGQQWVFASYMLLVAILGGIAGRYGLPQHVSPDDPIVPAEFKADMAPKR